MMRSRLKIRGNIFRGSSSPPARTNCLLARLLTDEDQERSTSIAHGKVVAAALRATLVALWQGRRRFRPT